MLIAYNFFKIMYLHDGFLYFQEILLYIFLCLPLGHTVVSYNMLVCKQINCIGHLALLRLQLVVVYVFDGLVIFYCPFFMVLACFCCSCSYSIFLYLYFIFFEPYHASVRLHFCPVWCQFKFHSKTIVFL